MPSLTGQKTTPSVENDNLDYYKSRCRAFYRSRYDFRFEEDFKVLLNMKRITNRMCKRSIGDDANRVEIRLLANQLVIFFNCFETEPSIAVILEYLKNDRSKDYIFSLLFLMQLYIGDPNDSILTEVEKAMSE